MTDIDLTAWHAARAKEAIEIPLTHGMTATIDAEDFHLVAGLKWFAAKGRHTWYAHHSAWNGTRPYTIRMHRLILGAPPGQRVDHRDGNGLLNRRGNLRFCTPSQNSQNATIKPGRLKGVHYSARHDKWKAMIWHDGRLHHLGTFNDQADAGLAYDAAARAYFGEFARCNFAEGPTPCP